MHGKSRRSSPALARCSSFRDPSPASAVSHEFCNYVKVTYLLCDRLKTLGTPGLLVHNIHIRGEMPISAILVSFSERNLQRVLVSGVLLSPDFDLPEKPR